MKQSSLLRILSGGLFAGILSLLVSGCGTKPIRPDLSAQVAPVFAGASIQVDLIGVNNSELNVWKAVDIDDYFSAGNRIRQGASRKTLTFGGGLPESQTLSANDPIWNEWKSKQVSFVIVLADLPGYASREVGVDLRRQVIPLDSGFWDGVPENISIQLTPTGIILVPAPKPTL